MNILVVTSVRNESLWLIEWVAYYRALGVEYFLIYTNDNTDYSTDLFTYLAKLPYIEIRQNTVTKNESPQKTAFRQAFPRILALKPDWVICVDPDEYLHLKDKPALPDFLEEFSQCEAVAINWRFFGSSGLKTRGMGFTIERFLRCSAPDFYLNRQFKTIFRPGDRITGFGPHRPWFRKDALNEVRYVFPDGVVLSQEALAGRDPILDDRAHTDFTRVQLNHYATRSLAEYAVKQWRGNGNKPNQEKGHFSHTYYSIRDRNEDYDDSILQIMPNQKKHYLEIIRNLELSSLMMAMEADFENQFSSQQTDT